jgi:hypothetical protein
MRPIAFRIRDFKSIVDSGVCVLSGDGITVLAGQNEAGKTAVLSALRDFDLEEDAKPKTADYQPDDRFNADPTVSLQFEVDAGEIVDALGEESLAIPSDAAKWLEVKGALWITRNLESGKYSLDPEASVFWEFRRSAEVFRTKSSSPDTPVQVEDSQTESSEGSETEPDASLPRLLKADEFAAFLRDYWPSFVYFDSFQDSLPRQVDFDDLGSSKKAASPRSTGTPTGPAAGAPALAGTSSKAPSSVHDFIIMADLDLDRVKALADQDKTLGNYLSTRSAAITGDFLTYWKQKVDQDETVDLRVRHVRDSEGTLKLAFYVHDKSDQYPDQRSKGFLWFLSFFLRLAAAHKRYPERKRILLIDEPGSYLHARAQRDVLHLFEDRIVEKDQIIYSTHSPYLIPPDKLHRLRIVLKTTQSGTKVLDRLTHPDLRGEDFADSLSPVITAIGIDITQSIGFNKERNIFVEGISDLLYLSSWASVFKPELIEKFNIFPGTGATTLLLLGSLFTGWGFKFVVLLDNDDQGRSTREKLLRDLLIPASRVVHPRDAKTIEDLFSAEDFRTLLAEIDDSLSLNAGEPPSSAIRRQNIDKVLLARRYSERSATRKRELTRKSQEGITRLLSDISQAWDQ